LLNPCRWRMVIVWDGTIDEALERLYVPGSVPKHIHQSMNCRNSSNATDLSRARQPGCAA
jgi:hypothetical protein